MTVRDIVLVLLGALAGFDACAVWWIYTLDRGRNADNRRHPTWHDPTS